MQAKSQKREKRWCKWGACARHYFEVALILLSVSTWGCAERLRPNPLDADQQDLAPGSAPHAGIVEQSGTFVHGSRGSAVISTVDASDYEQFQFLDLETGEAETPDWDVAVRRFLIVTNGGVSGDGGVQCVKLTDASFDDVDVAPGPDADWHVDEPDGPADEDAFPDTVFNDGEDDWYDYDLGDHSLTTKGYVYVIHSTAARYYKVAVESYYDSVGTSGIVTFVWQEIRAPEEEIPDQDLPDEPAVPKPTPVEPNEPDEPDEPNQPEEPDEPNQSVGTFTVNASSYDEFVYISLSEGVIEIVSPEMSTEWDLAVRRYVFLTNSGTSGPGMGGALLDESGLTFDELDAVSTDGFVADEILPASDAPGSMEGTGNAVLEPWYDYGGLGALTPKDQTFIIRTAEGKYGKLKIQSYVGGIYEITFLPIQGPTP